LEDARKEFGIIIPKTENVDHSIAFEEYDKAISLLDEKPDQPSTSGSSVFVDPNIEQIYIKLEKEEDEDGGINVTYSTFDNKTKVEKHEEDEEYKYEPYHDSSSDEDYKDDDYEESNDDDQDENDVDIDEVENSNKLRLRNKTIVKVEAKTKKRRISKLPSDDENDDDYLPSGKSVNKAKKLKVQEESEQKSATKGPKIFKSRIPTEEEKRMRKLNSESYLNFLVNFELAVKAIRIDKMRLIHAAKKYGIATSTLLGRLKSIGPVETRQLFTEEQEQEIINWLNKRNEKNPENLITAMELIKKTRQIATKYNIKTMGIIIKYRWLIPFIERNKEKIREDYRKKLESGIPEQRQLKPTKKRKCFQYDIDVETLEANLKNVQDDGVLNSNKQLEFLMKVNPKWKNLDAALKLVATKQCTVNVAAKKFEIPVGSFKKILDEYNIKSKPDENLKATFTAEQEDILVKWILDYPDKIKLTRKKFEVRAKEYAAELGYELFAPSGHKRFSSGWCYNFIKRNSEKLGKELTSQLQFHAKGIDPEEDEKLKREVVNNRKYYAWTPQDMQKAIELVRTTNCKPCHAAKQCNMSTTTLMRYLQHPDLSLKKKWTVFSLTQERHIVNWILERTKFSPVTCDELRNYSTCFAHENDIKLAGEKVSTRWIAYFVRRHKMKIGHLKEQLLTNRIVQSEDIEVEPYKLDCDDNEEEDEDPNNYEELEIDESEIPLVTE
jgi:hypothetical protein